MLSHAIPLVIQFSFRIQTLVVFCVLDFLLDEAVLTLQNDELLKTVVGTLEARFAH